MKNLKNLVDEYGSPLYCYDLDLISEKYDLLKDSIKNSKVLYAMKANYNPSILKSFLKMGAGIDAVSLGEVMLAMRIGFKPEDILYTANNATRQEIGEVYKKGVLVNFGSVGQLERFAATHPSARICLRINSGVVVGDHEYTSTAGPDSKFGIRLADLPTVRNIIKNYNIKVVGIHQHTGSGLSEEEDFYRGVVTLAGLIDLFPDLEFVNVGGGIGVPYKEGQEQINIQRVGRTLRRTIPSELEVHVEPGKYLVAESGHLLVEVTDIKKTKNKTVVGVNSGMSQLIRPVLYGAYHHITNLSNPDGEKKTYDVVGNICETGDNFATEREISEIRLGNTLAIHNAGAYCYSMGSNYNLRPMPPEVTYRGEKTSLSRPGNMITDMIIKIIPIFYPDEINDFS